MQAHSMTSQINPQKQTFHSTYGNHAVDTVFTLSTFIFLDAYALLQ